MLGAMITSAYTTQWPGMGNEADARPDEARSSRALSMEEQAHIKTKRRGL